MTSREKSSILSRLHEKRNDISILCISILSVCYPQLLSGSAFTSNIILGVLAEWGNNQREAKKIKQTHDFSFGSSLSLEPWNTWVSLNNGKPDTQIRKRETESSRLLSSFLSFRTWNEWFINEWFNENIQMFLWAREVQLLPEAREAHEVQGNQEHQRYQEHPTEEERAGERLTYLKS